MSVFCAEIGDKLLRIFSVMIRNRNMNGIIVWFVFGPKCEWQEFSILTFRTRQMCICIFLKVIEAGEVYLISYFCFTVGNTDIKIECVTIIPIYVKKLMIHLFLKRSIHKNWNQCITLSDGIRLEIHFQTNDTLQQKGKCKWYIQILVIALYYNYYNAAFCSY